MNAQDQVVALLLDARRSLAMQRSEFESLSDEKLIALHERLEQVVDQLGGLIPGATPPGRIEEFFDQVGEGMIKAQTQLDRESAAYNRSRPGAVLPASFRIPKVSAEIGFTMARKRSSGFRVFALGRGAGSEKSHSNRVTFDIVAAPPPAIERDPSPAQFIVDPDERARIADLLRTAEKNSDLSQESASAIISEFDGTLILVADEQLLLIHAGDDGALLFGILTRDTSLAADPWRFESFGALPEGLKRQGRWQQLAKFLSHILKAQRALGH